MWDTGYCLWQEIGWGNLDEEMAAGKKNHESSRIGTNGFKRTRNARRTRNISGTQWRPECMAALHSGRITLIRDAGYCLRQEIGCGNRDEEIAVGVKRPRILTNRHECLFCLNKNQRRERK